MFNTNDLLTMLQKGEDPQKIANEFANALNAAIEEKSKSEARATNKVNKMQEMINSLDNFLKEFYPNFYKELEGVSCHFNAKDLVNELDTLINGMRIVLNKEEKPLSTLEAFLKENHLL